MEGLMAVVVILLIVIVVWMVVITALYYSIYRGFLALREAAETAIPAQNEVIKAITDEMNSFMDILKTIEEQSLDCYQVAKGFVADAERNKDIAMHTIATTRQIQKTLKDVSLLERMAGDESKGTVESLESLERQEETNETEG